MNNWKSLYWLQNRIQQTVNMNYLGYNIEADYFQSTERKETSSSDWI